MVLLSKSICHQEVQSLDLTQYTRALPWSLSSDLYMCVHVHRDGGRDRGRESKKCSRIKKTNNNNNKKRVLWGQIAHGKKLVEKEGGKSRFWNSLLTAPTLLQKTASWMLLVPSSSTREIWGERKSWKSWWRGCDHQREQERSLSPPKCLLPKDTWNIS